MSESTSVTLPDIKAILASGLQFGHSKSKWNPLMAKYIYGIKNGIHIVDVVQTREMLARAVGFLEKAASEGEVIFVGTKKQVAGIIQAQAIASGAHFVNNRWAGGLFTNFTMSQRSLKRLQDLEKAFEEGVEGRTKYEISRMKAEWERLNRLYGGVKTLTKYPTAIVVIDPKFEKVAVREAKHAGIPVIALADTNSNPILIDYLIPGNDDALGAIELVIGVLAEAVKAGNKGLGVKHELKDYSKVEVKVLKPIEEQHEAETVAVVVESTADAVKAVEKDDDQSKKPAHKRIIQKGILEKAKDNNTKPNIKLKKTA